MAFIYIKTDKTQDEIEDRLLETIFLKKLELAEIDEETYSMGFPAEVTADSPDISVQDAENGIEPEKAGAAVRHDKTVSAAPGRGLRRIKAGMVPSVIVLFRSKAL